MLMAASDLKSAAISAVMVVPILAPMMKGNAFLSDTRLVATNGMINDVVMELDCTAAVMPLPQPKDRRGWLKI